MRPARWSWTGTNDFRYPHHSVTIARLSVLDLYLTENTITWNNAPDDGRRIGTVEMGPDDQWYEWDVTSYLSGKEGQSVSFVFYDEDGDNGTIRFSSEEGDNPPELKILH